MYYSAHTNSPSSSDLGRTYSVADKCYRRKLAVAYNVARSARLVALDYKDRRAVLFGNYAATRLNLASEVFDLAGPFLSNHPPAGTEDVYSVFCIGYFAA